MESLCCTLETNVTCVNYTSTKKKKKLVSMHTKVIYTPGSLGFSSHLDPLLPQDFGTCSSINTAWNIHISHPRICLRSICDSSSDWSLNLSIVLCCFNVYTIITHFSIYYLGKSYSAYSIIHFSNFSWHFYIFYFLHLGFVQPAR